MRCRRPWNGKSNYRHFFRRPSYANTRSREGERSLRFPRETHKLRKSPCPPSPPPSSQFLAWAPDPSWRQRQLRMRNIHPSSSKSNWVLIRISEIFLVELGAERKGVPFSSHQRGWFGYSKTGVGYHLCRLLVGAPLQKWSSTKHQQKHQNIN